jgi:phage/plasmid-associated DNA primase
LIKNKEYLNTVDKSDNEDNYGETSSLMKRVIPFVNTAAKDDEWLERTENTSLGYLLFKNGIYNMKTGKFILGFNPKIVFHNRIPWDFPEYDSKKIKNAHKISFGKLFENPKVMIIALARALAGDITIKKFYFCPGKPNAGKSKLVNMLSTAFGNYIGHFNAESLAYSSGIDSKDEGAKMRWSLLVRFSRILLSNEINMNKKMDGNAIKKHSSGGDKIIARTHHKEETHFTPHYTIFCLLNDIPKIEPMDEGIETRTEYLEFPYVFVDKEELNQKQYFKEKDMDIDNKIKEKSFIEGFIHIILDGYKDYLKNGMPEFDKEVKQKWTSENKQNVEIIDVIKERYDITNDKNDTVSISELKKFKENNKEIFATISSHRFNEILKEELKLEEGRTSDGRFWKGIVRKKNIDNIDFN